MTTTERAVHRASVAASIGLVLMVAATAGYIGWPRVANALGLAPAAAKPAYNAGERFDGPAEWYERNGVTLVIFGRASCAACEKAQPFLKSLVERMRGRAGVVLAHPPGAEADDVAYARSIGVADDRIRTVDAGLRVHATPTLVLVDRTGAILDAWEGAGPPERQAAIVKAVEAVLR
jgi:hypothetical protein